MHLAITGATGYIGQVLTNLALRQGHTVTAVSRKDPDQAGVKWMQFDLYSHGQIAFDTSIDCLVHLATDIEAIEIDSGIAEIAAAGGLLRSASKISARTVFVSSQAASSTAPTGYGRIKWEIEQMVLETGGLALRPGQVYGGPERGLYGVLTKIIRKSGFFPKFIPEPTVQPVHVEDVAESILTLCSTGERGRNIYCVGTPGPVAFSAFILGIAALIGAPKPKLIPVPVFLIRLGAVVLGNGLAHRLGLLRLLSLMDLPVMETEASLRQLRLDLRAFPGSGKAPARERRRQLIRDGHAILSYVLKEDPGPELLRRYVRTLESLEQDSKLLLPSAFTRMPGLIALIDRPASGREMPRNEFARRLEIAVYMAEATPQGARRFIGLGRSVGVWSSCRDIGWSVLVETIWLVPRILIRPLVKLELIPVRPK